MKAVSILLKLIAILAAAALYFVYAKNKQLNTSIATFNQAIATLVSNQDAVNNAPVIVEILQQGKNDAKDLAEAKEKLASLSTAHDGLNKQFDQARKENEATQAQLRQLRATHTETSSSLDSTKSALEDMTKKFNDMSAKYNVVNAEYATYRSRNSSAEMDSLKEQVASLAQQVKEKEEALKRAISRSGGSVEEAVAGTSEEKVVDKTKLIEGTPVEILKFDWKKDFIALNKGAKDGVELGEKLSIYNAEGNLVAVIIVEEVQNEVLVGSFFKNEGDPTPVFAENKYILKTK